MQRDDGRENLPTGTGIVPGWTGRLHGVTFTDGDNAPIPFEKR